MALWLVTQTTTHLWNGQQFGPDTIGTVDDSQNGLQARVAEFFGTSERAQIQYTSPSDGYIEAKVQWSPQNKQGWVRDQGAPGDYIVMFRAYRQD
jgi:hypothetical protein